MPVTERGNDDIVIQDHIYSPEIKRKNQKFNTSKKFSMPDDKQKNDLNSDAKQFLTSLCGDRRAG